MQRNRLPFPPLVPAFVSIHQSPGDSICAGTPVTLAATTINAGPAPDYAWFKFGSLITSAGDTSVYVDSSTMHGDVIVVEAFTHGVCAVHDMVFDTVALNIYPDVTPAITITTPSDAIVPFKGYLASMFSTVNLAAQTKPTNGT